MGANEKVRSISSGIALEGYVKHQLMDWHGEGCMESGPRIAGHSMQMLDAMGLLLGQDARRKALLLMLVDLKIVPPSRPR